MGAYLGLCLLHALSVLWLFAVPRHRREHLAFRLCCDPWTWYTNRLFLKPRIRIVGRSNLPRSHNGYLYASNHESLVDIVLLTTVVRRAFLMKRSVLLSPIGWGTYLSGSVPLDRGSKEARARAIEDTLAMAERSMSVVVFPEGTFGHRDGRLRRPHLRLLQRAWERGVPVVPLGHAGTRRAVDQQSLPIRTEVPIVLVVRPAVQPKWFPSAELFAQACWNAVVEAVREARREVDPGWPYLSDPSGPPDMLC